MGRIIYFDREPMSRNPMEQIPLNFDTPESEPLPTREDLRSLAMNELEKRFHEKTGFDPRLRFYGSGTTAEEKMSDRERKRDILIDGILDPQKWRDAVCFYDAEYERIGDANSGK